MADGTLAFCGQCGQALAPEQLTQLAGTSVCATCKPAFLRRLQEGAPAASALRYKGFWIRFLAKILDSILIDIVMGPIYLIWVLPALMATGGVAGTPAAAPAMLHYLGKLLTFELAYMGVFLAYNTLMLGRFGTTVGKMAIQASVVQPDGAQISYARALGRTAMEIVSGLILLIGYIIAGFDSQKRALHDRVAGTRVVARAGNRA